MLTLLQKESVMALIPVYCFHCHGDQVLNGGKIKAGKQRYKCHNADCRHNSFQLDHAKGAYLRSKSTALT
jgi:transposase-like protein